MVASKPSAKWTLFVFTTVFLLYNANGREIGSFDSQPLKLAARALARDGTLMLDDAVDRDPPLANRPGFARARDGHYRPAYSVAPAILAAGPAWLLSRAGLLGLDAPGSADLVAKLGASLLVALAVAFAFLAARRRLAEPVAAAAAFGFGLGTNLWAVASQTLWQHETVIFGVAAAVACLAAPAPVPMTRLVSAAACLALAGAARPQVAPIILVLSLSVVFRGPRLRAVLALLPLVCGAGLVLWLNETWFGHPLGAMAIRESLHPAVHAVESAWSREPWIGAAGLLVSPSRGLLVFSPIVLVSLAGFSTARREGWRGDLAWCVLAACAQFALYASYSVWWGGHTYGPRYCLDFLPLLVPLAAAGLPVIWQSRPLRPIVILALAWSLLLAATGAFCYPDEAWNTDPTDVDRNHQRLWKWREPQFARCWVRGPSPRNFQLFSREGWMR